MVNSDAFVSEFFVYLIQAAAENRGKQMPYMERLCDVYRRVIEADRFAFAVVGFAVVASFAADFFNGIFRARFSVGEKVKLAVYSHDFNEVALRRLDFVRYFLRDNRRAFA